MDPLVTRSGFVYLEADTPHRFVTQNYGERDRLYVIGTDFLQSASLDIDALAVDVALSSLPAVDSTAVDGPIWLAAGGSRIDRIAAGEYLARVGATTLRFLLPADVEAVEIPILNRDVFGFEDADGVGRTHGAGSRAHWRWRQYSFS